MTALLQKRNRFDLLIELIRTSFKMRYQNSILGILWVVIKPYITFIVLYLIWSRYGGQSVPNYSSYLLIGNITYTYFNELTTFGQMSLLDRAGIILKVNFPRQIAVVSALFSGFINLGINMILGIIILLISGVRPTINGIIYFGFIIGVIFLFSTGFALFTSILTIRFRDLKNIFELAIFLLFWLTPITYSVKDSLLSDDKIQKLILSSPITIVIEQARSALNVAGTRNIPLMIAYFVASLILLFVGWKFFQNEVKKISEYF